MKEMSSHDFSIMVEFIARMIKIREVLNKAEQEFFELLNKKYERPKGI